MPSGGKGESGDFRNCDPALRINQQRRLVNSNHRFGTILFLFRFWTPVPALRFHKLPAVY